MSTLPESLPNDLRTLQAALVAERAARREAEARASGAEAVIAHLKLLIAKLKRERFGRSAERGSKLLNQLELQLEELEATATADASAARSVTRRKPVRGPLPAHLPRERVVRRRRGRVRAAGEGCISWGKMLPKRWR